VRAVGLPEPSWGFALDRSRFGRDIGPNEINESPVKRPFGIYLVAFWCFIAMMLQIRLLEPVIKPLLAELSIPEERWHTIQGVAGLLAIWHVVYLIQLRAFNRWLSISVFGLWTLMMTWNLFTRVPNLTHPGRLAVLIAIFSALNASSIYYLVRKKFRSFAAEFVAERKRERHSRIMQETSLNRIRDGK